MRQKAAAERRTLGVIYCCTNARGNAVKTQFTLSGNEINASVNKKLYDKSRDGSTPNLDAVIDQMHNKDIFFVRLTKRVLTENPNFGLNMDYNKDGKNFIYKEATQDSVLDKVIKDNKIVITPKQDKIVSFIHKQNEKIYKYSVKDETVTDITNLGKQEAIQPKMTSEWEQLFYPKYDLENFLKFFKTTFTTASPQSKDGGPTVDENNPLVIVFEKDTSSGQSGGGNLVEI